MINNRNEARVNKNFAKADQIRKDLLDGGVILEDSAGETTWRRS
jgi:cysteinyl-tRNA synthetase